jgi:monoamine oxidase
MAQRLGASIVLASPVRRIAQTAEFVDVFSDTLEVRARHVVVATPPLLASSIVFEPALPAAHAGLLRAYVPCAMIRVVAVYEKPFWREARLTGESAAPESPVPVTIDQTPRSGLPGMLSSYSIGAAAERLARLPARERRNVWLDALAERYGPLAAAPIAYSETDWCAEEWSRGAMIAHFKPGVLTQYGSALRAPVGRIRWAGSERATEMHGLMEGAVRSGERAAREILVAAAK